MQTLAVGDCVPLLEALLKGISSVGVRRAFVQFGAAHETPLGQCAKSIGQNLADGQDFLSALQNAAPKLPASIENLLLAAGKKGAVDYALADALTAIGGNQGEAALARALGAVVVKYQNASNEFICVGCFERDFAHLLARARTEKATEVLLEQEGDRFFHQKFLAGKLVHIIEPSHSLTIRTFRKMLESSTEDAQPLKVRGEQFEVKKAAPSVFELSQGGKPVLKITFNFNG